MVIGATRLLAGMNAALSGTSEATRLGGTRTERCGGLDLLKLSDLELYLPRHVTSTSPVKRAERNM
jgi:hypothetical protein